jgi:hypothetical protein
VVPRASPLGAISNNIKVVKRTARSLRDDGYRFVKTRTAYTGNA